MTAPAARPAAVVAARLLIPLLRAGYGAALLCAPGPLIGVCTGQPPGPRARRVARVLGARHLAQAAVTLWAPGPEVVAVGAVVDLLHAASMFALAAVDRTPRRAEFADALAATALAVAEPAAAGLLSYNQKITTAHLERPLVPPLRSGDAVHVADRAERRLPGRPAHDLR